MNYSDHNSSLNARHRLCKLCQSLSFSLHDRNDCKSLSCESETVPLFCRLHSFPVPHQASFDTLRSSATSGCHLCCLLCAGLQSAVRIKSNHRSENPGVSLIFSCETTGPVRLGVYEYLLAICGDVVAEFRVDRLPETRCDDVGFIEDAFSHEGVSERSLKFRAICMEKEENEDPEMYVMDKLQPGEYYDVFDVGGDHWLARRLNSHKPSRSKTNAKRWIHRKHFSECTYPIHLDCCCGKGLWEPARLSAVDIGPIHTEPGSVVPQILDWIRMCDGLHEGCSYLLAQQYPARLLYVGEKEQDIVHLADGENCEGAYTTLSYKWGNTKCSLYVTTTSNLDQRKKELCLQTLPLTIKDAITLTRWLKVKYIWIDALCIVQDSKEDWAVEGSRMDQIYASSYLTISADAASSTGEGFLQRRHPLHSEGCIHPSLVQPYLEPRSGNSHQTVPQRPRIISSGIATAERSINTSILNERGWILQERLLSRRIIHWGEYEVSWECTGMIASERMPAHVSDNGAWDLEPGSWEIDNRSAWDRFREIGRPPNMEEMPELNSRKQLKDDSCWVWHCLVEEYTSRKLTVLSDRLPAISGLAQAFQRQRKGHLGQYLFGLWEETLWYDLCWVRKHGPDLRDNSTFFRNPDVPSFSWASVMFTIEYFPEWIMHTVTDEAEILDDEDGTKAEDVTKKCSEELRLDRGGLRLSIRLRGLRASMSQLPRTRADTQFYSQGTNKSCIFFDDENFTAQESVMCICIGVVRVVDSISLGETLGMFGILIAPATDYRGNNIEGCYERVGFYDGVIPAAKVGELERGIVTIM